MSARILGTQAANLIGYWKLNEPSGTTADDVSTTNADGTYAGTYTLAQAGIGDGSLSTLFGGGRVSLATPLAALSAVFSGSTGTMLVWAQVTNSGIWTDGLDHIALQIGADASNRFFIAKQSVNNSIALAGVFGGVSSGVFPTSQSWTDFRSIGITWDKPQNQFKAYISGVQTGATQTIAGTYVGALSASWTAIASLTSGSSTIPWAGNLAHVAVWKVALTAAEMLSIGTL